MIQAVEDKINAGELTEEEVIKAIHEVKSNNGDVSKCENILKEMMSGAFVSDSILTEKIIPHQAVDKSTILYRIELYESLTVDAKTIIRKVMTATPTTCPKMYSYEAKKRITKKRLREVIRDEFGWRYKKIAEVFKEIEDFCYDLEKLSILVIFFRVTTLFRFF